MAERPYVLLSVAASVDGYIDDASDHRLVLSGAADLDRVDEVRAGCDAILVGAGTIRRDNPRLQVRSQARRAARQARGLTPSPVKVTLTRSGGLDPAARFFATGDAARLVYAPTAVHTLFLAARRVDELQFAIAPFFVGDAAAPRFVGSGPFPHDPAHPMELAEVRPVGNVVLLRYLLSPRGLRQ